MKTASRILLSLSMVLFFAGMTFSQVASTDSPAKATTKQATFPCGKAIDASKDGTCAHHEAKGACAQGKNFVDKDGDGKCDNCGSSGKCAGAGCGNGQKHGDGCGKGAGKGNGCGHGQQQKNGCSKQSGAAQPEPKNN